MKEIALHAKVDEQWGYQAERDLKPSSGPNGSQNDGSTEHGGDSSYVHHQHKFTPSHTKNNSWAPSMDSSQTHPYGLRYDDGRMESAYPMVEAHQSVEEEEQERRAWGSDVARGGRPSTVGNSPNMEGGEWEKKQE